MYYFDLIPIELIEIIIPYLECLNLEYLNLNLNQINKIPIEISNLNNLSRLYLKNNQISKIPVELYIFCNKLRVLDLHDNLIKMKM